MKALLITVVVVSIGLFLLLNCAMDIVQRESRAGAAAAEAAVNAVSSL
jgi:hypothetical protein